MIKIVAENFVLETEDIDFAIASLRNIKNDASLIRAPRPKIIRHYKKRRPLVSAWTKEEIFFILDEIKKGTEKYYIARNPFLIKRHTIAAVNNRMVGLVKRDKELTGIQSMVWLKEYERLNKNEQSNQ